MACCLRGVGLELESTLLTPGSSLDGPGGWRKLSVADSDGFQGTPLRGVTCELSFGRGAGGNGKGHFRVKDGANKAPGGMGHGLVRNQPPLAGYVAGYTEKCIREAE